MLYVCVRPVSASFTITLRDRPADTGKNTMMKIYKVWRRNVLMQTWSPTAMFFLFFIEQIHFYEQLKIHSIIWFKQVFSIQTTQTVSYPKTKLKPTNSILYRGQRCRIINIFDYKLLDKWCWQTSAEGLVKLGVETPSTRPGWRYLKATQHPGLVWGERSTKERG